MTTYRSSFLPPISILPVFVVGSDAISTFQPDCTLPPNGTHFVRNPTARGSLSIFWNTGLIIVLCTWSVLHLNVPSIHSTESTWKKLVNKCLDFRIKIKWMLFTIIVPEFLIGKALSDWKAARHFPGGTENRTRTYLANMGYFVLEWDEPTVWTNVQQEVTHVLATSQLPSYQRVNIKRLKTRFWALNAWQWKVLSEANVAHLPNTPEWQLERLDHGSILIKILALTQVVYLIAELIVRARKGLPSTQLEVSALAFAVCSIVTYFAYFFHPQGVEALHYIKAGNPANQLTGALVQRLGEVGPLCLWTKLRGRSRFEPRAGPEPIPNDATHMGSNSSPMANKSRDRFYTIVTTFGERHDPRNKEVKEIIWGIFAGGMIFGGLHFIGLSSQFPTAGEATAWLWCCVVVLCLPFSTLALSGLLPLFGNYSENRRVFTTIVWGIIFVLYALSRLFLMVESVWALFYQPPGAFANTWSSEFPHW